jgi:hypothetical protein
MSNEMSTDGTLPQSTPSLEDEVIKLAAEASSPEAGKVVFSLPSGSNIPVIHDAPNQTAGVNVPLILGLAVLSAAGLFALYKAFQPLLGH